MKICPKCREEFLEQVLTCTDCKEKLVNSVDFVPESLTGLLSKEELFSGDMVAFSEGPLTQCREIEKTLLRAKVSCAVYPVNISSKGDETLGTTSELKYVVLIRETDAELARGAMEGKFVADVAKEGRGTVSRDAIDLDQQEITCPACGETGPLVDGDCQVCGLHLGV